MTRKIVLLAAATAALACTDPTPAAPSSSSAAPKATPAEKGLPDRDPALAKKLIAEGAVLLDVRTPQEWEGGHAAGATLIPIQELPGRMAEVSKLAGGDKDKPIVVYCASGARSGRAKQMLLKEGYTKVTNVGGLRALQQEIQR